jgi:peptidoglycan-associated lipoprotein
VRDRLVAAGIDGGRIAIKAAGDRDRLAVCATPLCQAQNRNSEVLINGWRGDGAWPVGPRSTLPPGPQTLPKSADQVPQ